MIDSTDLGEDGLDLGKIYDYDLIILDLMLPDMDGMDVIRQLRSAKVATPVLILSGLQEADKKVQGFGVGADDYLTKPFNREELVARIQAIVRRSKGHAQPRVTVGRLTVNLEARTAEVDNAPLHLTGKEYGILELLALRKGTTLTKEQFLNHLYGGMDEPELKIIDVFICKLRKKLATTRVALLFGSEKFGLSNEDMSHCDWLMHIATLDEHASMNLGQAVAVCLYEITRNPAAKAALDNSDWMFLLRQKPESIEMMDKLGQLTMDDAMKRLLQSLRTEHGAFSEVFIHSPAGSGVGRLIVDPYSLLLFSSRAEDFNAISQKRARGISVSEAIDAVLLDRSNV